METVLLLIIKNGKILLGRKKRGFGEGKFNGVGGKIEKGETPEEAMKRETMEEIGVIPLDYEYYGQIKFLEYLKGNKENVVFYLYVATDYSGEIKESDEIEPFWFSLDNIPYENMFIDDIYWLPIVLDGNKIDAFFEFDEDWHLVRKKIDILK